MKRFIQDIEIFRKEIPKQCEEVLDKVALKTLKRVKLRTPVGKKNGGTLRRNWKVEKGDLERIISNNTHYAQYVEHGHRTRNGGMVEGRYMLTKSIKEAEEELIEETNKILDKMWSR